jgi:hypothetical protein
MADYTLNVTINGAEQSVQTIGQLEAALRATNLEMSKIDQNTQEFVNLENQAKKLETELTNLTSDSSKFNTQLKAINTSSQQLNTTLNNTAEAAQMAGTGLGTSIDAAANKTTSLRTELRKVILELQNLEPGSARFQELSVRAGELRDQIGDTNNVVTALAGNTTERLGTALSGVANIGITGLQGVTGAMQLFGVESEGARKILEKLQGLLFLTQAIQGLGALPDAITQIKAGFSSLTVAREADAAAQAFQTEQTVLATTVTSTNVATTGTNTAATVLHTEAVVADAAATEAATLATRALSAAQALMGNPLALIGIAVTGLVATWALFNKEQKTAVDNIDKVTDSLIKQAGENEQAREAALSLSEAVRKIGILEIKDAEERNKKLKELEDKTNENLITSKEASIKDLQKAFNKSKEDFKNYEDAFIKTTQVVTDYGSGFGAEVEYFYTKLGEDQLKSLTKSFTAQRAVLDKQILDVQKSNDLSDAQKKSKTAELNKKLLELSNKYYIDYLTKQKEFLKQSDDADNQQLAKNIDNLIKSFKDSKAALIKGYTEQLNLIATLLEKQNQIVDEKAEEEQKKREERLQAAQEAYKRAYDDIKNSITQKLKEANDIETKYLDELKKLKFTSKIEELAFEQEQEEKKLEEIEKFRKEDIQKSVLSKKEKKKQSLKLETEILQAQTALDNFYIEQRKLIFDEELKLQEEKAASIKQINEILQGEILFGDQSTDDSKKKFALREKQLALDLYDFESSNLEDRVKQYISYLDTRKGKLEEISLLEQQLEKEQADAVVIQKLGNFEDYIEKEFSLNELRLQREYAAERKAIDALIQAQVDANLALLPEEQRTEEQKASLKLTATQNFQDKVLELNKKYNELRFLEDSKLVNQRYDEDINQLKKSLKEKGVKNVESTQEVLDLEKKKNDELAVLRTKYNDDSSSDSAALYQTEVNLKEDADLKKREIDQKYSIDRKTTENATTEEITNYKIAKLEEYNQFAAQSLQYFTDLFSAISDLQKAEEDRKLQILKESTQAQEKELNERYNAQIEGLKANYEQGLITQEEYNSKSKQLDDIRATSVTKLNNQLNDEQIKLAKKAFEREKKSKKAQAIIAGIQGAVSAYTGAFTSIPNPIAAAVVGGIFAALVAATTAVQVAAIDKTKFDETGLSTLQPPSTTTPGNLSEAASVAQTSLPTPGGFTTFSEGALGSPNGFVPSTPFSGTQNQKVYVLESDITSSQNRVRVLEGNSTFG